MKRTIMRVVVLGCGVMCLLWLVRNGARAGRVNTHSPEMHAAHVPGVNYDSEWTDKLRAMSTASGRPIVEVLLMLWDGKVVSTDFAERSRVEAFVDAIVVDGHEMLTVQQSTLLRRTITEFLFCNGTNNRERYYGSLLSSGETLTAKAQTQIDGLALERDRPEVYRMQPLSRLVWYNQEKDLRSHWQGLVEDGTRITVFATSDDVLPDPASAVRDIVNRTELYLQKTAPPRSRQEYLKTKGRVLIADLEVFVASESGYIRPYYCRYWFDEDDSTWRVEHVMRYPTRADLVRERVHIAS